VEFLDAIGIASEKESYTAAIMKKKRWRAKLIRNSCAYQYHQCFGDLSHEEFPDRCWIKIEGGKYTGLEGESLE